MVPQSIVVGGTNVQSIVARIEAGERDTMVMAEIDPILGETLEPIGVSILFRCREIECRELQGDDGFAVAQTDFLQEVIRTFGDDLVD